jgi:hypothetical protein
MSKLLEKMRQRRWIGSLFAAIFAIVAIYSTVAYALTNPASFAPRYFNTQQTHYTRFTVNFNSCVLVSGTCSVKIGAIPYNSWLLRWQQQIITSFNSATTDTVGFGVASGGVTLVAAQSVHGAAGDATALTIVHPGIATVGNGATQTGTDGGFDIWATYTQTGAAPTAGQAVYLLEFASNNDGQCVQVPLGATAGAC